MFRWISVELLPPAGGQQNLHRPKLDNSTFDSIMRKYIPVNSSYISVEKDDDVVTLRGKRKNAAKALKISGKKLEMFLGHNLTEQPQRTAVRHVQKKQRVH